MPFLIRQPEERDGLLGRKARRFAGAFTTEAPGADGGRRSAGRQEDVELTGRRPRQSRAEPHIQSDDAMTTSSSSSRTQATDAPLVVNVLLHLNAEPQPRRAFGRENKKNNNTCHVLNVPEPRSPGAPDAPTDT
ncbi:hypothetical protein EYF80_048772 [Liparis tanakae]|uniref:Uncharacterized protein n=1 Tax=Liparis tanakae TaxID=230148 RepID=A0A4Z2FJB5_9TELE|nr:hypothetical protein EYF80_048772 [Liparis tanakae]